MREQPTGSVTLVFTDIEGSTRLLRELGAEAYREALGRHRRLVREAFVSGYEVDEEGDAFFYAFPTVASAVAAVEEAMRALDGGPIRVRVGIHTGEPVLDPPKYVGLDVHRAARVIAAANGGQVLLSESTRALLDVGVVVRDLGEHRLKDLSGPQRLYQLGAGEFPPLKTLHQTNLPVAWTRLVGRERDLEQLLELLRREDVSVVTLTGAGGGGKTRLAMQTAAEATEDYADGVWFVGLAALTEVDLVEAAIAQTFGLREGGGRTYRDVVGDYLRSRRLLLVLDNLEQLLPEVARVVADLAAEFAGVDFLVDQPRAAPHRRRARVRSTTARSRRGRGPVHRARRGSSSTAIGRPSRRFARDSTACRWRSSLPRRASTCSPPVKLLERLERRLPC